jgi:putative PIN family toxin of toxin-antitoxin system
MTQQRYVVDNNVLVSRLLAAYSVPGKAASYAADKGILLVSDTTVDELVDVLARPKFDSYVTLEERKGFIERLLRIAERVTILRQVQACRDPRDDKFLEVAINGEADTVVTGDRDLLILHPFMGIPILSPADFLAKTRPTRGKNLQV